MKHSRCRNRSDRLLRKAVVVSLVVHISGIAALAAWHAPAPDRPRVGQDRTSKLVLTVRYSSQPPETAQSAEASVVVTPDFARLADAAYVRSLPQPVDIENLVSRQVRPVGDDLSQPMAPQVQTQTDMRSDRRTEVDSADRPQVERFAARPLDRTRRTAPPAASLRAEELQVEGDAELVPPDFRGNSPPVYPADARRNRWEGVVRLRLEVAEDGRVTQVTVMNSSGYPILDAAAVRAVRNWHGEPASRGGHPVATTWDLPIRFRLR